MYELIYQLFIFAVLYLILDYLARKKRLELWEVVLFTFISLNLLTFIHEIGHYIVLNSFGCHTEPPAVWFMFGATGFDCKSTDLQPWQWWLAAYAGPISAFLASIYFWNRGKDSAWRLAALSGFMYGTIPNLVWHIPGTDAYFAVSVGFPAYMATLILVGAISYISWLLYKEIAELG